MLKIDGQNMNFSGISSINDETIARFSANFNGNKELFFNIVITDYTIFNEHQEEINNDFIIFNKEALKAVLAFEQE